MDLNQALFSWELPTRYEGSDLKSPKLIKGPDIFIKSVSYL